MITKEKYTYTHTLTVPCRFKKGMFSKIVVFFPGKYREKVLMAEICLQSVCIEVCVCPPWPRKWIHTLRYTNFVSKSFRKTSKRGPLAPRAHGSFRRGNLWPKGPRGPKKRKQKKSSETWWPGVETLNDVCRSILPYFPPSQLPYRAKSKKSKTIINLICYSLYSLHSL